MIKILHINTYLDKGGAAKSVKELSELINHEDGFSSTVLAGYSINKNPNALFLPFIKYINVLYTRFSGYDSRNYFFQNKKRISQQISEVDIVHLHNLHGYYVDWIWLIEEINRQKKPIIWTLRDFWIMTGRCCSPLECEGYMYGCKKCPYLNKYPKVYIDKADSMFKEKIKVIKNTNIRFVTLSDTARSILQEASLKNTSIDVIYNGFDENKYLITENKSKKFNILFIASNTNDIGKGIIYLLLALERLKLKDTNIHIVGKKLAKKSIMKYLYGYNVIQYGYVNNHTDLGLIFNISDVFINTSVSETFGRTSIEALFYGLPVIAFDLPIMREILGEQGFFVKPKCIEDLMKTIIKVKNIKQISTSKNIERAHDFSSKKMIENYARLYKSCVLN